MPNKREIRKMYERLKTYPQVDIKRLDKALDLALSGTDSKYYTTMESCSCPDQSNRSQVICKHRLAFMLVNPNRAILYMEGIEV